jgi:hypothetical protein
MGAGLAGVNSISFATSRLRDFTTIFFDGDGTLDFGGSVLRVKCRIFLGQQRGRVSESYATSTEIKSGKAVEVLYR